MSELKPAPRVQVSPPAPSTPFKQVVGLYFGIAGVAIFSLGLQFALRGKIEWLDLPQAVRLWQIGPFISSLGCVLFCGGCVLIWKLTLSRLLLLIALAGALVGGVSHVSLQTMELQSHGEWGNYPPLQPPVSPPSQPSQTQVSPATETPEPVQP